MSSSGVVVSYLANAVWQVTLIAGAGWLVARLLRRLGPRAEHVAWVSTLAVAVLAPASFLLRPLFSVFEGRPAADGHLSVALVAAQNSAPSPRNFYVLPATVVWFILVLYLASLLCFAVGLARSLHRTTSLARSAHPLVLVPEQEEMWRHCKQLFSLSSARILSSTEISGPVVMG